MVKPTEALKTLTLSPEEREALNDFLEKLKRQEGDNLLEAVLFGSYARNEQSRDSDIDVAILLRKCRGLKHEKSIWRLTYDILEASAYRIRISAAVIAEETLKGPIRPLFVSIDQEGITVYERV